MKSGHPPGPSPLLAQEPNFFKQREFWYPSNPVKSAANTGFINTHHYIRFSALFSSTKEQSRKTEKQVVPRRRSPCSPGDIHSAPHQWRLLGLWRWGSLYPERQNPAYRETKFVIAKDTTHINADGIQKGLIQTK